MKAEKARIPITDFIKVWCELCRIRIDANEERAGVGGKTYHPDCYAEFFSAVPKADRVTNTTWISGVRAIRAVANSLLSVRP